MVTALAGLGVVGMLVVAVLMFTVAVFDTYMSNGGKLIAFIIGLAVWTAFTCVVHQIVETGWPVM